MEQSMSYRRSPSAVCTELEDGAVLLDLDTKYYYNLNETGLRIWQILEKPSTPGQIAEKLVSEYEVDLDRASASVSRILKELTDERLILVNEM
jgi:hypothetical protein